MRSLFSLSFHWLHHYVSRNIYFNVLRLIFLHSRQLSFPKNEIDGVIKYFIIFYINLDLQIEFKIFFITWLTYIVINNHAKIIHLNKLGAGCWYNSMYQLISIHFLWKRLGEWLPLVVIFISLYKKLFQKILLLLSICYYRIIKYQFLL